MLCRIKNGQTARLSPVDVIYSKLNLAVLEILKEEGFVANLEIKQDAAAKLIVVCLKYNFGDAVISELSTISKPGRRVYSNAVKIPKFHGGLGLNILSTSKGVMADYKARKLGVGGELLCSIF